MAHGLKFLGLLGASRGRVATAGSIGQVAHNTNVFLLKRPEVVLELVVPGIKDKDLEAESRGSDGKVSHGDKASGSHCRVQVWDKDMCGRRRQSS